MRLRKWNTETSARTAELEKRAEAAETKAELRLRALANSRATLARVRKAAKPHGPDDWRMRHITAILDEGERVKGNPRLGVCQDCGNTWPNACTCGEGEQ